MIVYPAIDLRDGKVVRLRQGDPERQRIFSQDPLETARRWIDQGAEWLHMVNLDGAFGGANKNLRILERVARMPVRVQFGGGLRDMAALNEARSAGAARLVIGTLVVKQPSIALQALADYGSEAICVGLDARDGRVATHGWTALSEHTPAELGRWLGERGAKHALYTDVSRDGGMHGVDIAGTIELARATGLQVIASGGLSRLDEIRQVAGSGAVAGAIIGMALYQGEFTLSDAIETARSAKHVGETHHPLP